MSTTNQPEPKTENAELPSGSLTLDPELASPTDLPRAKDLPDDADTVADPAALASLLTGAGDLRNVAASMIGAGAPAEHVQSAVERTEVYARTVTELLRAVDGVIADRPGAMADLHEANQRLAQLEQGRAK